MASRDPRAADAEPDQERNGHRGGDRPRFGDRKENERQDRHRGRGEIRDQHPQRLFPRVGRRFGRSVKRQQKAVERRAVVQHRAGQRRRLARRQAGRRQLAGQRRANGGGIGGERGLQRGALGFALVARRLDVEKDAGHHRHRRGHRSRGAGDEHGAGIGRRRGDPEDQAENRHRAVFHAEHDGAGGIGERTAQPFQSCSECHPQIPLPAGATARASTRSSDLTEFAGDIQRAGARLAPTRLVTLLLTMVSVLGTELANQTRPKGRRRVTPAERGEAVPAGGAVSPAPGRLRAKTPGRH